MVKKKPVETARVEHSVVVDRPIEEAFAYLKNRRNTPQWRFGVLYVKQLTKGPTGVGTKLKHRRIFLGQQFDMTLVVTEYEPNSKICLRTTSGPSSYEGCYTLKPYNLEPNKVGTRITFAYDIQPSDFFFFNLKESVFAPALNIEVEASLKLLKSILEA